MVDIKDDGGILEYVLNFAAGYAPGLFEVSFAKLDGEQGSSMEITRTGREFAVFSGMAEATRDFVKRTPDCSALYFTAKERSRARAYRSMVKRMARELDWTIQPRLAEMFAGWDPEHSFESFMLVRPGFENELAQYIMGNG